MSHRHTLRAATALAALAAFPVACGAGTLSASASCTGPSEISFSWTYFENPANPTGHPEWVGYDVMRRSLTDCAAFVRVNTNVYPRTPGVTETFTYTEAAPASGTTFQYWVVMVDANRQAVYLDPVSCDCSAHYGWASCPAFSAPLTQGTLHDLGWALNVEPCAGTCYSGFYFTGPRADELRPYAGTATVLRLYGSAGCGSVEGCAIDIDHYDIMACGPTPVHSSTWGRVKAIYR